MANCKIVFIGDGVSSNDMELECFKNNKSQVFIEIRNGQNSSGYECQFICLDKSTAIKFAKALRTEINKIID